MLVAAAGEHLGKIRVAEAAVVASAVEGKPDAACRLPRLALLTRCGSHA